MNQAKKERLQAQLDKKAEVVEEYASEVIMLSDDRVSIDGHLYVILANYKNAFDVEKVKRRFSQILTKYDYIVGDIGYDQLRMRGFYDDSSHKGIMTQKISKLQDYLYEYCNFGCAYFILKNMDVQELSSNEDKAKRKLQKRKIKNNFDKGYKSTKHNKKSFNKFNSKKKVTQRFVIRQNSDRKRNKNVK